MITTGFLQLDDRNRAQLGKYLSAATSIDYRVEVADDGVITLSPAQVVADHELRLLERRPTSSP